MDFNAQRFTFSVVCPFCKKDMDAFFQTEKDAPPAPEEDGNSLSVCANCYNVGKFYKPAADAPLSLRKLDEVEWTTLLTEKKDVIARIDLAKKAIMAGKLKLQSQPQSTQPETTPVSISDYLE